MAAGGREYTIRKLLDFETAADSDMEMHEKIARDMKLRPSLGGKVCLRRNRMNTPKFKAFTQGVCRADMGGGRLEEPPGEEWVWYQHVYDDPYRTPRLPRLMRNRIDNKLFEQWNCEPRSRDPRTVTEQYNDWKEKYGMTSYTPIATHVPTYRDSVNPPLYEDYRKYQPKLARYEEFWDDRMKEMEDEPPCEKLDIRANLLPFNEKEDNFPGGVHPKKYYKNRQPKEKKIQGPGSSACKLQKPGPSGTRPQKSGQSGTRPQGPGPSRSRLQVPQTRQKASLTPRKQSEMDEADAGVSGFLEFGPIGRTLILTSQVEDARLAPHMRVLAARITKKPLNELTTVGEAVRAVAAYARENPHEDIPPFPIPLALAKRMGLVPETETGAAGGTLRSPPPKLTGATSCTYQSPEAQAGPSTRTPQRTRRISGPKGKLSESASQQQLPCTTRVKTSKVSTNKGKCLPQTTSTTTSALTSRRQALPEKGRVLSRTTCQACPGPKATVTKLPVPTRRLLPSDKGKGLTKSTTTIPGSAQKTTKLTKNQPLLDRNRVLPRTTCQTRPGTSGPKATVTKLPVHTTRLAPSVRGKGLAKSTTTIPGPAQKTTTLTKRLALVDRSRELSGTTCRTRPGPGHSGPKATLIKLPAQTTRQIPPDKGKRPARAGTTLIGQEPKTLTLVNSQPPRDRCQRSTQLTANTNRVPTRAKQSTPPEVNPPGETCPPSTRAGPSKQEPPRRIPSKVPIPTNYRQRKNTCLPHGPKKYH